MSAESLLRTVLASVLGFTPALVDGQTHDGHGPSGPARMSVGQVNPWSHLKFDDDPNNFQFAIVTDRTGGHRAGVFPNGLRKVDLLKPEFVMSVGDLIEGYSQEPEVINSEWDEFDSIVAADLDAPFFYVPGNHDISNEVAARVWEARFGPSYYHFVYKDVLFLCLNTEDEGETNISDRQIAYVDSVLSANQRVRWTLVFLHEPLWVYTDEDGGPLDTGWARIEGLIAARRHSVFAGHFHRYQKYVRQEQSYFILATTGGASSLRGPLYGEFDHVVWVTMTDDGPEVANLMLDGVWDEEIRNEQIVALTDPLLRGWAISIPPIFVTADEPSDGFTTDVRLLNKADVPLRLIGRVVDHPALRASPPSFDIELPPNGVERFELAVTAAADAELREHETVTFEWLAEYQQHEIKLPRARDGVVHGPWLYL